MTFDFTMRSQDGRFIGHQVKTNPQVAAQAILEFEFRGAEIPIGEIGIIEIDTTTFEVRYLDERYILTTGRTYL
jgi:hypothetical protein